MRQRLPTVARAVLASAYLRACELDVLTFKPGNVGVHGDGHRMTVEDFQKSAIASVEPLVDLKLSLGERVFHAVERTWDVVGTNTNLGIVLLCAPLLAAAGDHQGTLRERLQRALIDTDVNDAEWLFKAIRRANPAGLGSVGEGDVFGPATMTLFQAMTLSAERDRIGFQYATAYSDIFEFAIPLYHCAIDRWRRDEWACLAVFAGLLCKFPDSHVQRKHGNRFTGMVKDRMSRLRDELWRSAKPEELKPMLVNLDFEFKSAGINPGTTADLTVATALAVQLSGLEGSEGGGSLGCGANGFGSKDVIQ